MKKFLSLLLCITILMSSVNMAFAAESAQDTYNMISVEFSDNIGISETLQVMINDENVYADVEELAARLGYDVNISDEYVAVYNKTLSKNVPYGLTVFYYDRNISMLLVEIIQPSSRCGRPRDQCLLLDSLLASDVCLLQLKST